MAAGLRPDSVQMSPATTSVLEQVFQVMDYLYRADLKYVDDYRAALVQSFSFVPSTQEGQWLNSRKNKRHMTQVEIFTLNFWCLNPGVVSGLFLQCLNHLIIS
ncbi:Fanconi anemia group J protein homolog [Aplysia californica]|uniref:Fanconi anemia group J protein homolog n=1 Tax=Aplysia californica TaxID=6500 RepID=A0ABM1VUM8_APLCA|nr:Fanconi anemia group J protein homolog [Aplysia californica]